jgi:hypothetical protein
VEKKKAMEKDSVGQPTRKRWFLQAQIVTKTWFLLNRPPMVTYLCGVFLCAVVAWGLLLDCVRPVVLSLTANFIWAWLLLSGNVDWSIP